jgi:hypothetical protein
LLIGEVQPLVAMELLEDLVLLHEVFDGSRFSGTGAGSSSRRACLKVV